MQEQLNEDRKFIPATGEEQDFIELGEDDDLVKKAQERNADIALRQAQKVIKKNSREIKRLRKHAEEALFEGHKERYKYAIKKIRTILRQPTEDEILETLWETSLKSVIELCQQYQQKQAS